MATMTKQPNRRLGEFLLDGMFISSQELNHALDHQRETNERLGETLVRLGVLSKMELKAVLASHAELDTPEDVLLDAERIRHRLGDILLKAKRVKPSQLDRALDEQNKTNEKLGEVLVRFGVITQGELDAVLTWQRDAHSNSATAIKLMLGEILVATDIIKRDDLKLALQEQHLSKKQIGEILVDAGLVKPNQIVEALKIQSKLFSAALVAVLAAGALTGCGMTAPGVATDNQFALNNDNSHGAIVQYDKSSPMQHVQTTDRQHNVTVYQNGAHIIDDVPWVHQKTGDNTCAQAASSVLFGYWGIDITYQQVVNEANRFNLGTTATSASSYLKSKGLNVQPYKSGNIDFLQSLIDKGHPTMVVLDYEGAEHWLVVVGYQSDKNGKVGSLILHDSIEGPHILMKKDKFIQRWQNKTLTGIPVVGGQNYQGLMFDTWK